MHTVLGIAAVGAIVGFILFAFHQGLKVKPTEGSDNFPFDGSGSAHTGGS
jgi:hypothetical protein